MKTMTKEDKDKDDVMMLETNKENENESHVNDEITSVPLTTTTATIATTGTTSTAINEDIEKENEVSCCNNDNKDSVDEDVDIDLAINIHENDISNVNRDDSVSISTNNYIDDNDDDYDDDEKDLKNPQQVQLQQIEGKIVTEQKEQDENEHEHKQSLLCCNRTQENETKNNLGNTAYESNNNNNASEQLMDIIQKEETNDDNDERVPQGHEKDIQEEETFEMSQQEQEEQHPLMTHTQILHTPYRSVGGKATKSFSIPIQIHHYNRIHDVNNTDSVGNHNTKNDDNTDNTTAATYNDDYDNTKNDTNLPDSLHAKTQQDHIVKAKNNDEEMKRVSVEVQEHDKENNHNQVTSDDDDDDDGGDIEMNTSNHTIESNNYNHTDTINNINDESTIETTAEMTTNLQVVQDSNILPPPTTTDTNIATTSDTTTIISSSFSSTAIPKGITLTFENFVDLQTRLVLLPFKDDECLGALVASYMQLTEEDDYNDNIQNTNDVNGYILTGIQSKKNLEEEKVKINQQECDTKDWTNEDYTNILFAIRDSATPIVLQFHEPNLWFTYQQQSLVASSTIMTTKQIVSCSSAMGKEGDNQEVEKKIIPLRDEKDENMVLLPQKSNDTEPSSLLPSLSPPSTSDMIINSQKSNDELVNSLPLTKNYSTKKKKNKKSGNNNKNNRDSNESKNKEDKKIGRFQRWGSQIAAEATKAVIAGKEIAREKVNERFLSPPQQQQQQQPQKIQRNHQDELTLHSGDVDMKNTNHISINGDMNRNNVEKEQTTKAQTKDEIQIEEKKYEDIAPDSYHIQSISLSKSDSVKETHCISTSKGIENEKENKLCGLFLQTNFGNCIPLDESLYRPSRKRNKKTGAHDDFRQSTLDLLKKSPPIVSNTSVLVIRKSASEACSRFGYCYQWYKTSQPANMTEDQDSEELEWMILEGATYAVFQPSVTDVGFRVKCVVSIDSIDEESSTNTLTQENNTIQVTCELPFIIESDYTLFNAAMKTFVPMTNGAEGMKISSFGNLMGRDEFQGLELRVNLHIMQDNGIQGGFYMSFEANTDKPLHDPEKQIVQASGSSYYTKAKSFFLIYRFGLSEDYNLLKLKSPSRLARETFLIALGIALYQGDLTNLNKDTVLFPKIHSITPKGDTLILPEVELTKPTSRRLFGNSDSHRETPVSKMMAIENELEQDMFMMRDKLETKNKIVSDLHQEISRLHEELNASKAQNEESRKNLRLSERRIESLESDIQRVKKDFKKHEQDATNMLDEKDKEAHEQTKLIKSLKNEKAVLSAAVEARDSKLAQMSLKLDDMEALRQKTLDGERAKSDLEKLRRQYAVLSDAMKEKQSKEDSFETSLKKANSNIERLQADSIKYKNELLNIKAEASKVKSQFQKARGERNTYKQKAESLAKEMSRICKNGRDIGRIETIIKEHQEISEEVVKLRSEKKMALDELQRSRTEYEQYILAQIQAASDNESVRIFQRNRELERVVTDMTEFLTAKQMQLETVQEANRNLIEELRLMAEKCRDQNDI